MVQALPSSCGGTNGLVREDEARSDREPWHDRDVTTGASSEVGSRTLRRRLRETSCPTCGHPWEEHPGAQTSTTAVCDECVFDRDHEQAAPGATLCRAVVPAALFRRAQPEPARPKRWRDRFVRVAARVVEAVLDAWP